MGCVIGKSGRFEVISVTCHAASHHPVSDFSPYISIPCRVLFLNTSKQSFSNLASDQGIDVFGQQLCTKRERATRLRVRIDCASVLQSQSLPLKKKASPRIWATASKWLVHLSGASRAGLRYGKKKQKKRKNKLGKENKKKTPKALLAIRWQWRIYRVFFPIDLLCYKQTLGE